MKATGIVRRIDELGRIVIPKEIRRTLRIREGDPLEIFTDREGQVILKKYSPIDELGSFSKEYAEALSLSTGHITIITDKDNVVAVAGCRTKDYLDRPISDSLEHLLNAREKVLVNTASGNAPIDIVSTYGEANSYTAQVIVPIISSGDAIGAVVFVSHESSVQMGDTELKICEVAASFLGKQMEN